MEVLITLVISLIVFGILWYMVQYVPEPMQKFARLILVVGGLLYVLLHAREWISTLAHG